MASGSELHLAVEAFEKLTGEGVKVRVVSMPCWELFDQQDAAYRNDVLPPGVTARVVVEAGVGQGWEKYQGPQGRFIGMSSFGASGPYKDLYNHFGITTEAILAEAKALLG